MVGFIFSTCDIDEYLPIGFGPGITLGVAAGITLSGVGVFNIRNPSFGNSEDIHVDRAFHVTRGGDHVVFREGTWPKTITFRINVTALKRIDALAVLTFIKNNLGTEVTYTDQDARVHTVFIRPEDSGIAETSRDIYEANLALVGAV